MCNVFTNKIGLKDILFLQETNSSIKTEKKWIDDFNDNMYYSHRETNSCGIFKAIYVNLNICVKHKVSDNGGRVLILEAIIDGSEYLLLSF